MHHIHLTEGIRLHFPARSEDFSQGVEIGMLAALMSQDVGEFTRRISNPNVGQARALAVTAESRIPQAPSVPTLAEAGVPDAASYAWIGLVAPASMPSAQVARLAAEAKRGLGEPQTRAALERAGFEVVADSPAEFARFIAAESDRWGSLITRLGIKAET